MTLSLFSFHVLLFGEGACLQLSGAGQEAPGIPAGYFRCSVIGRMDGRIKAILKNLGFLVTDGQVLIPIKFLSQFCHKHV